jgi:outer membrane protein OmpA-like peptidoglycan-associated protein
MQTNKILGALLLCFFYLSPIFSQATLEGYTFEEGNRGYLNQVKIMVYKMPENAVIAELVTDADGHFITNMTSAGEYRVVGKKDIFYDKEVNATVGTEKVFLKMEMKRKPGYLFDATIADARDDENVVVDAIQGANIEIYNRTQRTPVLVLQKYKNAFFQYTFEQGNHYTVLLRKPGYLAKRIEAYVNIEGCIICVNGVSDLRPGVTDNLTEGNSMGTLLCNIEMEKVRMDKRIALQNIYYDYNKFNIRSDAAKELDKAVQLMVANPGISVELGSHTDARGSDTYNQTLSQQRAEAAVAYIIGEGVDKSRITAKGYGESQVANRCANGVNCSEDEHQKNRRTELRITGISQDSLEYLRWESLEDIVREEDFKKGLKEVGSQKEYKVEEKPQPAPTSKQKQMPEANNSVPLPKINPSAAPQDKKIKIPEEIAVKSEETPVTTRSIETREITTNAPEITSKPTIIEETRIIVQEKANPVVEKTMIVEERKQTVIEEIPTPVDEHQEFVVEEKVLETDSKERALESRNEASKDVEIVGQSATILEDDTPINLENAESSNIETPSINVIKNLPHNHNGFNIEIALTDFELRSDHPIFQEHGEIFVKQDGADKFSYYIGNFENVILARNYYQSVAIPNFPSARLCQFKNGKMTYTK